MPTLKPHGNAGEEEGFLSAQSDLHPLLMRRDWEDVAERRSEVPSSLLLTTARRGRVTLRNVASAVQRVWTPPLKSSVWTPAPTVFWSEPVLTLWVLWQLQSIWFVEIRLKCVLLCGLHRTHTDADPESTRDSTVPALNRRTHGVLVDGP